MAESASLRYRLSLPYGLIPMCSSGNIRRHFLASYDLPS